ncbi:MAG: hypothetical protein AB7I35_21775 [Ramlibacter sp.]
MTQPTNAEIEGLLGACKGACATTLRGFKATTWKNRVLALHEAFNLRTRWHGPQDLLLREAVAQYLRGAGLTI